MHELSLAEGIRDIVEETATMEAATRVRRIVLEIGALAAVDADALRFCLDEVLSDSIAEGAEVDVIDVPGRGRCRQCGTLAPIDERHTPCLSCGAYGLEVLEGDRMRVQAVELE